MKKNLLFSSIFAMSILGLFNPNVIAQNKVLANKTKIAFEQTKANAYNLFTPSYENDSKVDAAILDVTYLKLNKQALTSLLSDNAPTIIFTLPINGKMTNVKLERRNIYDEDFKAWVLQSDNTYTVDPNYKKGSFYRGYIDGKDVSLAAFSFYDNELGAIFSIEGAGNYNLVMNYENPGINNDNYLLFNESNILNSDKYRPACETTDDFSLVNNNIQQNPKQKLTEGGSCKYFTLALYGDYKLFVNRGNSLTSTQNYLTTMFNGNATLFENDEIKVSLKNLYVNQTQDNYPSTSSTAVLNRFGNDIGINVTADLMQMVTGYINNQGWSPMGGLAWLDVLCITPYKPQNYATFVGPFSMTNNSGLDPIPLVPIYSWDVSASTHEMGHNLGSPHTHACKWNGNNTTIDGCGPTYDIGLKDIDCAMGPIPSSGTIMSYCHLLQNVGVNFNNGFGAQPKALIINKISNASCLPSISPTAILNNASQTITANQYCVDNNWAYFYFDNNDNNATNDILVLAVNNNAISTMDLSNVTVSTTTTNGYSSNQAAVANYNYALYNDWHEINRTWSFNSPNALTGTSKIRFPFHDNDFNDVKGSLSSITNMNQLKAVVHTTNNANANPAGSDQNQTKSFDYSASGTPGSWVINNSNPSYKLAEITVNTTFYGGTMGYGTKLKPNNINNINGVYDLNIYPNPADETLMVDISNLKLDNAEITIIDNLGRTVIIEKIENNTSIQRIDISKIAAGFYSIKLSNNDGLYVAKFIKK